MSTAAVAEPATNETARRLAGWRWIALGVAVAYFLLLFVVWPYQHWSFNRRGSVMEGWVRVLMDKKFADWRFCWAVPFVTGWLVYRERARLKSLKLDGSWWGAFVLVLAGLLYWAGYMVDTGYLGYAALQLSLAGLILLLAGTAWMRVLFLPWLFLAFAWPFFPLDDLLAARLKTPTAQGATLVLSLTGVDLIREGSTLISAADPAAQIAEGQKFRLDVSNDCSGMKSLYALITFGVLYAIIALRGVWPRILLAASAIPLAVIGNIARLLLLAYGSLLFGQDFAVGKMLDGQQQVSAFHLLAGFAVFAVALVGMFGLTTLLERWSDKKKKGARKAKANVSAAVPPVPASSPILKSAVAMGLGIGIIYSCWATPTSPTLAEPGLALKLPALIDYPGEERGMEAKESGAFDPGVQLVRRRYLSPSGRSFTATIVLSGTVKKTLHTPENCLPDMGWVVSHRETVPVTLADGRTLDASLMHIFYEKRAEDGRVFRVRGLHLYWYHGSHGVSTPSYQMHNLISYRDAIFRNLNHRWCQVSFYTVIASNATGMDALKQEMDARDELISFAGRIGSSFVKE